MNTELTILKSMIKATGNKFFTVQFVKKDKTIRKMTCQLGVKKHLKSNASSTTSHIDKYITVYDVQNKAYRTVNLETIQHFKCGNFEFVSTKKEA